MPKIKTIECYVVEQPLEQPFTFSQWAYVKWAKSAEADRNVTTETVPLDGFGPGIGMLLLATSAIWQTLYLKKLDYARSGVLMASVSALDVALWDLQGKLHTCAYGLSTDAAWIHLYGGGRLDTQLSGGALIKLSQQSGCPHYEN